VHATSTHQIAPPNEFLFLPFYFYLFTLESRGAGRERDKIACATLNGVGAKVLQKRGSAGSSGISALFDIFPSRRF
jgi:hypothetical protein